MGVATTLVARARGVPTRNGIPSRSRRRALKQAFFLYRRIGYAYELLKCLDILDVHTKEVFFYVLFKG